MKFYLYLYQCKYSVLAITKYSRTLSVFRNLVLALISSVPLPVPNLWKQFRTRRIYVPQNQNSPVPRAFCFPVLRYGYVEGYGIHTRTSGYGLDTNIPNY